MKIKGVVAMSVFFSLRYDLFFFYECAELKRLAWSWVIFCMCNRFPAHAWIHMYAMPVLVSVAGLGQLGDILHVQLFSCTCMNTSVCNAPVSVSCWTWAAGWYFTCATVFLHMHEYRCMGDAQCHWTQQVGNGFPILNYVFRSLE